MNAVATATIAIPEDMQARVTSALASGEAIECPGRFKQMDGQMVACRLKQAICVRGVAVFKCRRCGTLFAAGEAGA